MVELIVQKAMLRRQMEHWCVAKSETQTQSEVFRRIIHSAINARGRPQIIGGKNDRGQDVRINRILSTATSNYDVEFCRKQNTDVLTRTIKRVRSSVNATPLNKSTSDKIIRGLSPSIVDAAKICMRLKDGSAFRRHFRLATGLNRFASVDEFAAFDKIRELSSAVHGIRFALACDTLKEVGLWEYGKPDTHVMEILPYFSNNIYKAASKATRNQEAFQQCHLDLLRLSKALRTRPYELDKLIYVICSGSFHTFGVTL